MSTWSKDPSTQTGAVITDNANRIISLGYNGFPSKLYDTPSRYKDRETKYSMVVHCEMNAVLNAHIPVIGCTLYTWPFISCDRCAVHMIQAGIIKVVCPELPEDLKERWSDSVEKSKSYFEEAGVEIIEYKMID